MMVGLLDDEQAAWLGERGLMAETTPCHLIDDISYSRSQVKGNLDAVLESLTDDATPPFYVDFLEREDSIAERIIEAHPTIDQVLRMSPSVDPREVLNAETIQAYDPELGQFVEIDDLDLKYDHDCLMTQWRYDRRRYYSVRTGSLRLVDRDMAICASLRNIGRRFFEIRGDDAFVPSNLALPMLLERSLLLAGASVAFVADRRRYEGVPNPLLRQISYRLGIAPRMEHDS
jgi:hypothetical protein